MENDFFKKDYEDFEKIIDKLNSKELEKYKTIAEISLKLLAESGDKSAQTMLIGSEILDKLSIVQGKIARQDFENEESIEKYNDFYMQLYLEINNFMKENNIKEN